MNTQGNPRNQTSFFAKAFLAGLMMLVALPASTAFARQWTIDNKKVEGTVTAFDGQTVTLKLKNNDTKTVSVQQLNASDLSYLKTLMELNSMTEHRKVSARQQAIQMAQLQVMLEQYRSQWYEMWVVQFVGPNGEYFYWAYPVRNSYQAMTRANYQFPNARILGVRKLRRQW